MYKSRITKWKLDKRNKGHEMAVIVRKKVRRDAVGKESTFRLRGRPVDLEDLFCYLKRKKIPIPQGATPDAATPSDMSCWTPRSTSSPGPILGSPRLSGDGGAKMDQFDDYYQHDEVSDSVMQSLVSALPRSVTPPQHLVLSEQLRNAIKIYISGSLDNRVWISNEHDYLVTTRISPARKAQSLTDNVEKFRSLCNRSRLLLGAKDFNTAGQHLSKAFGLIRDILIEEEPSTLDNICFSLSTFLDGGFEDISTMFRTFIGQMAINVLPSNHPWCQICKLIGRASADDVRTLIGMIWKCSKDTFVSKLGPFHSSAIASEIEFLRKIQRVNDPRGATQRLRQLLVECEKVYGKSDYRSLSIALGLFWILREQGRYAEAVAVGESHLVLALDCVVWIHALWLIEDSHYNLGNRDQFIQRRRERIELILHDTEEDGPFDLY